MTFPDTVQCASCGHRFHSGVPELPAGDVPKPADDWANRTQMFEMPPHLGARTSPDVLTPTPVKTNARWPLWAALAGVLVIILLAAWTVRAHSVRPPLGAWTLQGAGGGTVGLTLSAGGDGRLQWTGSQPGSVPLRWGLDSKQRLTLSAAGSLPSDPTAARSVGVLTGQAWEFQQQGNSLVLGGRLEFTK